MFYGRSTALIAAGAVAVLIAGYSIMGGQQRPKHCVFCSGPLDRIVYEDADFLAFHDIKPDAELHLLVVPREHYGTIKEMTIAELPMITRMHELGQRLLEERGYAGDMARFGFHRPPFNSIHHLHLHCLGLPFRSRRAAIPFTEGVRAWFVPAERLINDLSKGQADHVPDNY
ncbi:hypothetical protein GGH94_002121 [Coemansia aciculifera]|uniref:HIT domain-containing protein n=1 Tax=Coemansia aciculifera TaxID=417176 RepID=A0A9W8M5T4_9FUNG|nr:hypothetical protein GGH94_002121 [Coemansia aciculifera]KAJ2875486.1 hypothetical protein GGH93_001566 [Coemansia aciculifera]